MANKLSFEQGNDIFYLYERGYTQNMIAKLLGIPQSRISVFINKEKDRREIQNLKDQLKEMKEAESVKTVIKEAMYELANEQRSKRCDHIQNEMQIVAEIEDKS